MQSRLDKFVKFIESDKVHHFLYGIVIFAIIYPFGEVHALVLSILVAVLKEYLNSKRYGYFSKADLFITANGMMFLFVWYNLVDYLRNFI